MKPHTKGPTAATIRRNPGARARTRRKTLKHAKAAETPKSGRPPAGQTRARSACTPQADQIHWKKQNPPHSRLTLRETKSATLSAPQKLRCSTKEGPVRESMFTPAEAGPDMQQTLEDLRGLVEKSVTQQEYVNKAGDTVRCRDGAAALRAVIRSGAPIQKIHNQVAEQMHATGEVAAHRIAFEKRLPTALEGKNIDVSIIPEGCEHALNLPLHGNAKERLTRQVIAIGVKSQLASSSKNQANNFAGVRSDPTELHELSPAQVVGHVQLIAVHEIDSRKAAEGTLTWRKTPNLARTLSWFMKANGRARTTGPHQHLERAGVILADLKSETPHMYTSITELVADGLISRSERDRYSLDLEGMLFDSTFAKDILRIHAERFPNAKLT